LKRAVAKAVAERTLQNGNAAIDKVLDLHREALENLRLARASASLDAANGAVGAATRAVELAAKLTGELAPAGGVTVNLGVRIDQARAAVDIVRDANSIAPREVVERALRVCRAWNAANPDQAVSL
jgi:hypothetical protein